MRPKRSSARGGRIDDGRRRRDTRSRRNALTSEIRFLKIIKYAAMASAVLLVAGILTLMVLTRGKTGDDGDIAGVVAPALLLTVVSGVVAVLAAVLEKRANETQSSARN